MKKTSRAALKTTGSGGTFIMGMIPNGTKYYGAGCVHCPVQGHHRCLVQPQQQEIAHDTWKDSITHAAVLCCAEIAITNRSRGECFEPGHIFAPSPFFVCKSFPKPSSACDRKTGHEKHRCNWSTPMPWDTHVEAHIHLRANWTYKQWDQKLENTQKWTAQPRVYFKRGYPLVQWNLS